MDKTDRGFDIVRFKDRYDVDCSIQKSSLATEEAIWIGVSKITPVILSPNVGWVPYYIPEDVCIPTRMHLTQEQVANIIPILQRFVDTGEL